MHYKKKLAKELYHSASPVDADSEQNFLAGKILCQTDLFPQKNNSSKTVLSRHRMTLQHCSLDHLHLRKPLIWKSFPASSQTRPFSQIFSGASMHLQFDLADQLVITQE